LAALFPGRQLHLHQSGTAALAVALLDAKLRQRAAVPEAIVPAYGCPQLVAACLHAGVRPRVVDTVAGGWGYDLPQLRAALSADCVAVLAVNLLGTGDQVEEILRLARASGALVIQDSAQHLPTAPTEWPGDYVVLSFGRGKPLNLLRGGALAVPDARPLAAESALDSGFAGHLKAAAMGSRAAGILFNTVTHPAVYGLTSRLPGLGLGATRYASLERVFRLPRQVWGQLGPAYEAYSRERWIPHWDAVAADWQRLGIVRMTCPPGSAPRHERCLRLPLLAAERAQRDRIVATLRRQGLGASPLYAVAMDRIENIPAAVSAQGPFPNATELADRLFTLPTHTAVTADAVRRTMDQLRALAG
jgi:dTDP-4-amino-4,6-dideoxygalactose transaminase